MKTAQPQAMKIGQIRAVIDALNWTRQDLGGATRDEFKRMDVAARLQPRIAACEALQIPERFARDIESRAYAIDRARAMLARWSELQPVPQPEAV